MLEQLVGSILEQIEQPKHDISQNIKALLQAWIEQMDLVTQQEITMQKQKLMQAEFKLAALQQQFVELEEALKPI